ncbi:MAG: cytochrome b/b6 domain-containing protein, partial [Burkholderiaceae bacterium]
KVVKNMTSDHEYPSHKFNGGEKMVFWIVLVLCTTMLILSGFVLLFPNFGQPRSAMQIAQLLHMLAGYGAISLACVHFYLGTVGLNGAYRAMTHGYVTAEWAHHHHELWYEDAKAGKLSESPMVNAKDVPEDTRKIVLAACK